MTRHDESHVRALEGALSAEGDPRGAIQRAGLADCPECAAELAALLEVEARVAAVGTIERSETATLRRSARDLPAGLAEATLRGRIKAESAGRWPWMRRNGIRAVALATVAAGIALWVPWNREPGLDLVDVPMGSDIVLSRPIGDVRAYTPFLWKAQLPEGGWFVVRVYSDEGGQPGAEVDDSGRLYSPRWDPESETTAAWPDRIVWTLEVFRGSSAVDSEGPFVERSQRLR